MTNHATKCSIRTVVIPPKQDSQFVAQMEQVLGIYKLPYDKHFPVVCMDESPKQLIGTTRFEDPIDGNREKREDYE